MFIPVVLVNLVHIGILRKECYKYFLAVINCFTGIFCYLYLYVRQRGVKSQNKMDFREISKSMSYTRQHFCKLTCCGLCLLIY